MEKIFVLHNPQEVSPQALSLSPFFQYFIRILWAPSQSSQCLFYSECLFDKRRNSQKIHLAALCWDVVNLDSVQIYVY